jgi:hypothetical protein
MPKSRSQVVKLEVCVEMADTEVSIGVSFSRARGIVTSRVKEICAKGNPQTNFLSMLYHNSALFLYLVFTPILSLILLIIASAFERISLSGLIVSIIVVVVSSVLNIVIVRRYKITEQTELLREVNNIVHDYITSMNSLEDLSPKEDSIKPLYSGHSQVSIVSVYRDESWHRLPTLLLVEGDIIALSAGDLTPGKVYELIPTEHQNNHSNGSSHHRGWQRGKAIENGYKIPLRQERKKYSESNLSPAPGMNSSLNSHLPSERYKHNRAIHNESTELLVLSGDIRCFIMRETLVDTFLSTIIDIDNSNPTKITKDNIIRKLFQV